MERPLRASQRRIAPVLGDGVRFVQHDQYSMRLYESTMQHFVQLDRLECHLAQLMNGQRSIDELVAIGRQYSSALTKESVERLVVSLNAIGLLDHASSPTHEASPVLVAAPAPDLDCVTALTEMPADPFEEDLDGPTVLSLDAPTPLRVVDPDITTSAIAPQPIAAPPMPPPSIPPIIAPAAPADPPGRMTSAAEVAAQEQAELLKERRRAWHQRTWLRVLAVLAILAGAAAVIPYPLRVTSECVLIPSERVKVRSEIKGALAQILVDEGHTVKKGDVIARIDDRALKAEREKVVADIEKIEADLTTLQKGHRAEELEQQRAVLAARRSEAAFAAKEAQRRRQMVREGVGSRHAADEASRELATRMRAAAEADAALRLLMAGSRPEEIAAQEAILKRAKAELAYVDEKLAMTVVRAPIDGEILTPHFRERLNEGVEVGGLVCEIANTRRMRAEILVPEREVDVITIGMPATVKVESYPTHPFEGTVNFVAPTVDGESKRVRVVVELANEGGMLKSNMTGYGEIEAGSRSLLALATRRFVRWIRVRFLI